MSLTTKENYLRMLRGEVPGSVPAMFISAGETVHDELPTPVSVPNGRIRTVCGVTYAGK